MQLTAQVNSQIVLMNLMMKRIGVAQDSVMEKDGGLAWLEARTKCVFCRRTQECRAQLEQDRFSLSPRAFCPNAGLFYSGLSQILREKGICATD